MDNDGGVIEGWFWGKYNEICLPNFKSWMVKYIIFVGWCSVGLGVGVNLLGIIMSYFVGHSFDWIFHRYGGLVFYFKVTIEIWSMLYISKWAWIKLDYCSARWHIFHHIFPRMNSWLLSRLYGSRKLKHHTEKEKKGLRVLNLKKMMISYHIKIFRLVGITHRSKKMRVM